jgi:hypothetical protein
MLSTTRFHEYLRDAGIPINGVSDHGEGDIRIHFREDATDEQRARANALKHAFDWRARRLKTLEEIDQVLQLLPPESLLPLLRRALALQLRTFPDLARQLQIDVTTVGD